MTQKYNQNYLKSSQRHGFMKGECSGFITATVRKKNLDQKQHREGRVDLAYRFRYSFSLQEVKARTQAASYITVKIKEIKENKYLLACLHICILC